MHVLTLKIMPLTSFKKKQKHKQTRKSMGQHLWSSIFYGFSAQDNALEISQGGVGKGPRLERMIMKVYKKSWHLGIMWNFLELKRPFQILFILFVQCLDIPLLCSTFMKAEALATSRGLCKSFCWAVFWLRPWNRSLVQFSGGAMKQVRDEQIINVDELNFVAKALLHFFDGF